MKILPLEYVAGCIDCDGSICITISQTRYKRVHPPKYPIETAQFGFNINLRQLPKFFSVLRLVHNTIGIGGLYRHASSGRKVEMASWHAFGAKNVLAVCRLLEPHLYIKKKEARLMIRACELWLSKEGHPQGGGRSHPIWIKAEVARLASRMNTNQQKETSRRNKELRNALISFNDLGYARPNKIQDVLERAKQFHPQCTLTESDVVEIRRLKGEVHQKLLADRFKISQSWVSKIQRLPLS